MRFRWAAKDRRLSRQGRQGGGGRSWLNAFHAGGRAQRRPGFFLECDLVVDMLAGERVLGQAPPYGTEAGAALRSATGVSGHQTFRTLAPAFASLAAPTSAHDACRARPW